MVGSEVLPCRRSFVAPRSKEGQRLLSARAWQLSNVTATVTNSNFSAGSGLCVCGNGSAPKGQQGSCGTVG